MKNLSITFITLFILIINSATLQDELCSNALTQRLKSSKDESAKKVPNDFLTKTGDFQMCQSEWNTYGSCCNPDQLNQFSKIRLETWSKDFQKFIDNAKEIKNLVAKNRWIIIARIVDLYKRIDYLKKGDKFDGNLPKQIKKMVENYMKIPDDSLASGTFDLDIFYLIEDEKKFEDYYQNFLKDTPKCFEDMLYFQKSMMCFMCSGRAGKLTFKDKIKMHQKTCRKVINRCIAPWTYVYSMTHIMKAFSLFSQIKRKYGRKEAPNMKFKVKFMGPDTTFRSGVLAFLLKEINYFRGDYKFLKNT